MRKIDKILSHLENLIREGRYEALETERIELKSLSTSDNWKQLYISACAFLNTQGGIIVLGIHEDVKKELLSFTGFDANKENKLKELAKQFTDGKGNTLDVSNEINNTRMELRDFYNGKVCLVFVDKLPEDKKYAFYNGTAYKRELTGDHKISDIEITKQEEYKKEIIRATELEALPNATLDDLDIDLLNEFIQKLNDGKKVETLKPDIQSALPFLIKKRMVEENHKPTLLGIFVCGKNIFDIIGGKCELDAYFKITEYPYEEGENAKIADDRKIYKDNIIPLMESGWDFIFNKTAVGISIDRGGSPVYEYPERIIREMVNNALAHRDYRSERFSILEVINRKHISIRNPGKFRQEQLIFAEVPLKIRRIIPNPKAQNPKLADILKLYNRWEGRGIGMATLTNYSLANKIDVPYYRLYPGEEIALFIPKGKVWDEAAQAWLNGFHKYISQKNGGKELTEAQKTLLAYLYKSELLNEQERYTINLTPDNNHSQVISDLEKKGLIEKLPNFPLETQVYRVDPVLRRSDFSGEMLKNYGSAYSSLSNDWKEILESIYQHNEYGTNAVVSASLIGNHLFLKRHSPSHIDIREFGNFKRRVRNAINKLEKEGYITRKQAGKPDYQINTAFQTLPQTRLF